MPDSDRADLPDEIRRTRDRLAARSAHLDQLQKQVDDLECIVVEIKRDRRANRSPVPGLVLGVFGVIAPLALSTLLIGRWLPSLVALGAVCAILAIRVWASRSDQRAGLPNREATWLLTGAGAGLVCAFTSVPLGPVLLFTACASALVLAAARVPVAEATAESSPMAPVALRLVHTSRLHSESAILHLPLLVGVCAASFTAFKLGDPILTYTSIALAGCLGLSWTLKSHAALRALRQRAVVAGLGQAVVVVGLICISSTFAYGAVRANSFAPYRPPAVVLSAQHPTVHSSPPSYAQLCGPWRPGAGAPATAARAIHDRWLGPNGAGGAIAGCATPAQLVSSSDGIFYARGYGREGQLLSVAIADRSGAATLILGHAATLAAHEAARGTLRFVPRQYDIGGRTLWVLGRSRDALVAVNGPPTAGHHTSSLTVVSPAAQKLWLGGQVAGRFGLTWPSRTELTPTASRYAFIRPSDGRVVAELRCSKQTCTSVSGGTTENLPTLTAAQVGERLVSTPVG